MSPAVQNAKLMSLLQRGFGAAFDFERYLERDYRTLIGPGNVVIDIGAHIGRHSKVFADLVGPSGRVHAFEPLPYAFEILAASNLPDTVTLHNVAVSMTEGMVEFVYAKGAPEESGLRIRAYNGPESVQPELISVRATPLDALRNEIGRVDFIKIDAEGGEVGCIESGRQLIMESRPFISVEYGAPSYSAYGHTAATLFELAVSMDYVVGDLFGEYCTDVETWNQVCDVAFWDYFLIPREKIDLWQSKIRM